MKKRVFRVLLLAALAFVLVPGNDAKAVTVKKNNAKVYIVKDRKTRMNVSSNKTGVRLIWRSNNTKIIQAENDVITGINTGRGKIYTNLNEKKLTANVTVMALDQSDIVIGAGTTKKLKVVNGSSVKWKSSNPKIADVKKGKVTAYQPGLTYITAKSHGRKMQCLVRVPGVDVSATILSTSGALNTATITPLNFVGPTTITSSDPSVAKIDKNGILHAVKGGYTYIVVKGEGVTVMQRVDVNTAPVDIFIQYMVKYNNYVKKYGKRFAYGWSPTQPFYNVEKAIKAKKKAYICCNAPIRWAFAEMGFSYYKIWAISGKFPTTVFKGSMTKYLTRVSTTTVPDSPVGLTIKNAVDTGKLKKGDIIAFKGITHAFVYSGNGYYMYDGGRSAKSLGYNKVGITVDYNTISKYKTKKISQVLRWRDISVK